MVVLSSALAPPVRRMAFLFLLASSLAPCASAQVVFNVNSTADQLDDNAGTGLADGVCHTVVNTCTLRAAVFEANRVAGVGATILLPAGTYLFTRGVTGGVDEHEGDLDLLTPAGGNPVIALSGVGAATTIIDANQLDRVLTVSPFRTATISGITLRNGRPRGVLGGGILNQGALTANLSVVSGNTAPKSGGGIASSGALVLDQCTLGGNVALDSAGGLYNESGNVDVIRSTIAGNRANIQGGGIYNSGSLNVTSSTISGNRSNFDGGGIFSVGTALIQTSTIAFNEANADADQTGDGAGIYSGGGQFSLQNSVVAGNYRGGAPDYDDCTGPVNSFGRNKFWFLFGCPITQFAPGSATFLGSLAELGPLQDNGGPTLTHALRPPSSMIDGAEPTQGCRDKFGAALATDQRGAPRTAGVGCDVGAYEFGSSIPGPVFVDSFE